jgi:carbon monoxide dehydrogenase subunit G
MSLVSEILKNINDYPTWSSTIKSVTVDETDGNGYPVKVTLVVDAGVMKDRPTLSYDWSQAPAKISFSLDDADLMTEMTGVYLVKDNGDETTDVTYELTVNLSMPVPAMMRKKAEQATIDLALSQLKKRAEG